MLTVVANLVISTVKTVFLPVTICISIMGYIYNLIFIIPFLLSDTCVSIFGDTYGCMIIRPDYVFTHIFYYLVSVSLLIHLMIKFYEAYSLWLEEKQSM